MRDRLRRHRAQAAAAALALILVSCSKDRPAQPPTSPGPPAPTTDRIEIVVPAEIAPGESVQLTATAFKSDGSTEDVSRQAAWTSDSQPVLTVTATGMATAQARGEANVTARLLSKAAAAHVFVLPKGTFALKGVVREQGFAIAGVAITIVSGTGEGLTTESRVDGSYALYGVAGAVQLHSKKDGYSNGIHQVSVTGHMTRDLDITGDRPRDDYRGTYTLTITAAVTCNWSRFPPEARRRVYTATVAQEGARLAVTLSDADFILFNGRGNGFVGHVDPTGQIALVISDAQWDFYGYYNLGGFDIVERVSGQAIVFLGIATVTGTPARLSGAFKGWLARPYSEVPPFYGFQAFCGPEHQFEMVRR